jgi:hypothetical protein
MQGIRRIESCMTLAYFICLQKLVDDLSIHAVASLYYSIKIDCFSAGLATPTATLLLYFDLGRTVQKLVRLVYIIINVASLYYYYKNIYYLNSITVIFSIQSN